MHFMKEMGMFSPHSFTSKRAVSPNPYLDNPVNGYACPTGMALHYDDVPINGMVRTHLIPGGAHTEQRSRGGGSGLEKCHMQYLFI